MIKSKTTIKAYILFLYTLLAVVCSQPLSNYHLVQVLDYPNTFNDDSDLSVIVVACGGKRKLQLTIKSFLYFNTYTINKLYIVHCSLDTIPVASILPFGYQSHRQFVQVIGINDENKGLVDALMTVYQNIATKFVYQTDGQWVMTKGFGFIEKSMAVLKQVNQSSIKASQVVSNYPYWRAMARLSQMKWTKSGDAYHQILAFAPQKYSYFTLSPSVFEFTTIYYTLKAGGLKKLCQKSQCADIQNNKYEFDKCCLWFFGQQISKLGYSQLYLNDGSGLPNHQYISQ